jgi:hypothetical protein
MADARNWSKTDVANFIRQWSNSAEYVRKFGKSDADLGAIFISEDITGKNLFRTDFTREYADFGLTAEKGAALNKQIDLLKDGAMPTFTSAPATSATAADANSARSSGRKRSLTHAKTGVKLEAIEIMTPVKKDEATREVSLHDQRLDDLVAEMMSEAHVGDIEVAVVSIMGKFRTGKSFLLNLIVEYFLWLEQNQERLRQHPRSANTEFVYSMNKGTTSFIPEWMPEDGLVEDPFQVDEQDPATTCTQGLWVLNKVFFLDKPGSEHGEKMAVIIMDSQGCFDGELDDKQSRAILGSTAVFSSTCIYNVLRMADIDVQYISDLMNIFKLALDNAQSADAEATRFGKLCWLIRDAIFKGDEGTKLNAYYAGLRNVYGKFTDPASPLNGTEQGKQRARLVKEAFSESVLFGLPSPGNAACLERRAKTKDMKTVDDNFKHLLDEFLRDNFEVHPIKPVQKVGTDEPLTAKGFKKYLQNLKAAFVDCAASGGDPALILMQIAEKVEQEFSKQFEELAPDRQDDYPEKEVQALKKKFAEQFRIKADRTSFDSKNKKIWADRLDIFMDGQMNGKKAVYYAKKDKGDKALMIGGVGTVACAATPLGGLIVSHWLVACVCCVIASGVGYQRHCTQHDMKWTRFDIAGPSYAKTGIDRFWDVIGSAKRMAGGVGKMAGGMAGAASAGGNAAGGNSPAPSAANGK